MRVDCGFGRDALGLGDYEGAIRESERKAYCVYQLADGRSGVEAHRENSCPAPAKRTPYTKSLWSELIRLTPSQTLPQQGGGLSAYSLLLLDGGGPGWG